MESKMTLSLEERNVEKEKLALLDRLLTFVARTIPLLDVDEMPMPFFAESEEGRPLVVIGDEVNRVMAIYDPKKCIFEVVNHMVADLESADLHTDGDGEMSIKLPRKEVDTVSETAQFMLSLWFQNLARMTIEGYKPLLAPELLAPAIRIGTWDKQNNDDAYEDYERIIYGFGEGGDDRIERVSKEIDTGSWFAVVRHTDEHGDVWHENEFDGCETRQEAEDWTVIERNTAPRRPNSVDD
jgi:hypothetical protein